ncbi:MAG TPA: helix-turn-helix transcriptional regulator [Pedobacter sp.]
MKVETLDNKEYLTSMVIEAEINPLEQYVIDFVRKLRIDHDLSQRDIAMIINTSISFIGNVESKRCTVRYNLKHINLLAAHFKLSPKTFFPEKAL